MTRRAAAVALLLALATYAAYGAALYAVQDTLIFPVPDVSRAELDRRAAAAGVRVHEPVAEDGTRLYAWHVPGEGERALLFLHGNGGLVTAAPWFAEHLPGWDVVSIAYRGYPGSEGQPSEEGLVRDARAAWRLVTEELGFEADRVVVQGQSLGGGVALHLVSEVRPAALVLDSTFHSLEELAAAQAPGLPVSLLLAHPFRSHERAPAIDVPVLVLHGDADTLIPVDHGRRLAALLPTVEYVELPGLGHDHWLLDDPTAFAAWRAFLNREVSMSVEPSIPPFPAARIRDGMPVGTRVKLRSQGVQRPAEVAEWEVVGHGPDQVTIRSWTRTADGTVTSGPDEASTPWTELESHAHFPADRTKRSTETLTTALGTLQTWRYDVDVEVPGAELQNRFWFAPRLPGAPILMVTVQDGEEVFRMEMIEHSGL